MLLAIGITLGLVVVGLIAGAVGLWIWYSNYELPLW